MCFFFFGFSQVVHWEFLEEGDDVGSSLRYGIVVGKLYCGLNTQWILLGKKRVQEERFLFSCSPFLSLISLCRLLLKKSS